MEELFDKKTIAVLKLFLNNSNQKYYLREIVRLTKVPLATVYRIIIKLVSLHIIELIKIKRFKLYMLGYGNEVNFLKSIFEQKRSALNYFIEHASKIPGIKQIILHGEEKKDKANLLILAESLDEDIVRQFVVKILEEYNFTIMHLTLNPHQFEQMSSMGLYPGKKIVLFQR